MATLMQQALEVPIVAPPRATTPPPPPSREIPQNFASSFAAWWSDSTTESARQAEDRLLRRLPMYEPLDTGLTIEPAAAPTSPRSHPSQDSIIARLRMVGVPTPDPRMAPSHPAQPVLSDTPSLPSSCDLLQVPMTRRPSSLFSRRSSVSITHENKGEYINTLEMTSEATRHSEEAVVVLHGYGAALGFFFKNWEAISSASSRTSRRTFFLDWLGMGCSSRPSPKVLLTEGKMTTPERVAQVEHFFLSSLEAWRVAMGVKRMVLVGHSLGGYLATAYAVRHPGNVSGLVLISPVGFTRGPQYKSYPLPNESRRASDASQLSLYEPEPDVDVDSTASVRLCQWEKPRNDSAFRPFMNPFFVNYGWERGWSPFTFLRATGPLGPMLVGRYSSKQFVADTAEDARDLHAYMWNVSVLRGSGEFCITHLLTPGAYARMPVLDRIHRVSTPVTFIYGDSDWMDPEGGREAISILKASGNTRADIHVIPNSGHQPFLNDPELTNTIIADAICAIPVA